jgi:pimeloyl-ACP methyl ester carboxylesterase
VRKHPTFGVESVNAWQGVWPPRVKILIPGIRTKTDDPQNWAPLLADDIMQRSPCRATEYRYFSGPLTRRIKMRRHVLDLSALIRRYSINGYDVDIIAHSNGTILALRAAIDSGCTIRRMDLIASAAKRDCTQNGINTLARAGRLSHLVLYVSPNDRILQWGRLLTAPLNPFNLGYHDLGRRGPKNMSVEANSRTVVIRRRHSHSGWLREPETWALTMSDTLLKSNRRASHGDTQRIVIDPDPADVPQPASPQSPDSYQGYSAKR